MLMRDEDRVQFLRIFADVGDTQEGLTAAEPCVDEDAGAAGGDINGIAGTAAGQGADLNDGEFPPLVTLLYNHNHLWWCSESHSTT
jgi:hypothetical protein